MFIKKRYYILLLIIVIIITANKYVTLRKPDSQIKEIFRNKNQQISIIHDSIFKKSIRYLFVNSASKNSSTLIFVHGAPGSSADFLKYLQDSTLRKNANLIAIDRLGYGFSEFGKPETSISKQASTINALIKRLKIKHAILIGWSYGGPIIAKAAIDNPKIKHLVLLAPAVSPKDEKHFWLGNFAKWKLTKWMVPKPFVVAEAEKLKHTEELKLLDKQWNLIKTPIIYFHGDKDFLVPYSNMKYLKQKVDSSLLKTITLKGRNHFIPFTEYEVIRYEILKIVKKLNHTTNR